MKTNNTMTLPKRLLDAASTDPTRTVLNGALIDAEHRSVVVCNGRVLAIHPIPGDAPVKPGYITPQKWKAAKARNAKEMTLDFTAGTLNGEALDEPDVNGNYPAYRQINPTFDACYRTKVNPSLIASLAASLGCVGGDRDGLAFEFDENAASPIRITYKDAKAVLMPMGLDGEGGLRVASGKSADAMRKEIEQLKEALSERSDNLAASGDASPADAALIESLKSELHEARAQVRQLEAQLTTRPNSTLPQTTHNGQRTTPPPAPPVKQLDGKPSGKAATKVPKAPVQPATERPTLTRNAERDGIELRFNGKPDDATRETMKTRGWRWLPGQPGQPWARKYTEEEWLFANSLATGSAFTPMPEPVAHASSVLPPASCGSVFNAPADPVPHISQWTRSTILPAQSTTPATPAVPSRVRRITLPEF